MIQLPRLCDREYAFGDSGFEAFVNNSELEGHRDRRSLKRAGVEKFPIHQDGDGYQAGLLSLCRQLDQSKRTRLLDLGSLMPVSRSRTLRSHVRSATNRQQNTAQDDGQHPIAI